MRSIIKHLFFITIIFSYISGLSQEENSDAVFLEMTKAYTLNEDGSWNYNEIKKVKLLTYYSFHRLYGETFIVHDPGFQDLKINEAYTIMADGTKVPTPKNAFNLVLPRFASKAPPYNKLREMIVTHTGLENGAVINLDYSIFTSKEFSPFFMGDILLTERMPVNSLRIIVKIPAKQELHHEVYNIRTAPDISEKNGIKTYVWTFKSLRPRTLESNRPSDELLEPRLTFSTTKNLFQAFDLLTDQPSFQYGFSDEMKKWASSFMKDGKNEITGLVNLQEAVVNEINYWPVPPKYIGYKCREATETFNSNGGTELEKTVLLTSLYESLGYQAIPVAIFPTPLFDKAVGNLEGITSFAVQLKTKENGSIYLLAIHKHNNDYKYGFSDHTVVVIDPNIESLKTYDIPDHENKLAAKGDFKIIGGEEYILNGNLEVEVQGGLNPWFKIIRNQDAIKDVMKPGFTAKNITSFEIVTVGEAKTNANFIIEKKGIFKEQENYLFWNIPKSGTGFSSNRISFLSENREAPLQIHYPIYESYEYSLTIPDGMALVTPEESIEIKNEAGIVVIKLDQKKDKVNITRILHLKDNLYKPVLYKDFKALVDVWINPNYTKLVFKQ
jgi:hypothetical protein